ncbi:L-dopachrome tautomerase yellow-f2-like isoform X2 [Arctopsyche grandis]|uniref:L-dopachrome tautomerase yellow-f2-like isoform X2 n=1 Tax=Arctopsyche grandis TaxID=121162 RepID=UPI00406D9D37
MKHTFAFLLAALAGILSVTNAVPAAKEVGVAKLEEVYAWKQITYNIDGVPVLTSRYGGPVQDTESDDAWSFPEDDEPPKLAAAPPAATPETSAQPSADQNRQFFNQYNNIPMGVDHWQDKLFITVPRRRGGIPSTLNYLSLAGDKDKSPGLRPYPNLKANSLDSEKPLVNVYRTRIDACDRLWMVDTGIDETPGAYRVVQPPSIVIYNLKTNELIKRYDLKSDEDYIYNDPSGFASITVDVTKKDCDNAYAYLTDLANYGLVVYSLKEDRSWRMSHNYFYLDPEEGDFNIAGLNFQWGDGIFSIALGPIQADGYRTAYFHAMASFKERAVNTRVLRNETLATRSYHEKDFVALGERGPNTQTTIHGVHQTSGVMFAAQVGRNALACWNTNKPFKKSNFDIVAQDNAKFIYPSDLKIDNEDNVWIMVNSMPIFLYSNLNTDIVNFRVYKTTVKNAVSKTVCV